MGNSEVELGGMVDDAKHLGLRAEGELAKTGEQGEGQAGRLAGGLPEGRQGGAGAR